LDIREVIPKHYHGKIIVEGQELESIGLYSDLVSFPSYAAAEPAEPKFTLTGEEGEQHSLLDLLLLVMRRICELIKEEKPDVGWNAEATLYWKRFLGSGSVACFMNMSKVGRASWGN